ncbi:MAG TPA: fibronectin type III domain-containing protein [Verrucomicrobiae bacterium]|nr:fibronectin type III domain-containing protein [Verrucomicrobiae bacterium]
MSAQSYTAEPVAEPRPVFDLPLVAPEAAPETGTFWLYSKSAGEAGWPPLPFDPYAGVLPLYILPGGQYLVADTPTDFAELQALQFQMAQLESGATLTTMDSSSELPPFPDDGDTNSGGGTLNGPPYTSPSYPSNALWLEITGVSNGVALVNLHGTVSGTLYELLSKEQLTNADWQSEAPLWLGAENQDWTPAQVPVGMRTNQLLLWARSWADADGNGIPDWWEQQYLGQSGVDAYADPDGDGWANLQEYQNGTDPNNFNTSPAPQGLVVHVNDAGTVATVDWLSTGSAVTGYVVERSFNGVDNDYSVIAPSYVDNTYLVPSGEYDYADIPAFRVRAQYANGLSAWSDWQWPQECLNPVSAQMVTTPSAGGMLSAQNIPADADALRLNGYYFDEATADYVTTNLTLAVADFTNGLAMLPTVAQSHSYFWNCQALRHSGLVTIRGPVYASDGQGKIFMDGREHLRQNLAYALRAASVVEPFVLSESAGPLNGETSLDCLVADYHWADDTWLPNLAEIDVWQPFEQNYALRNTAFDPQALDANGWLTTGFTNNPGGGFSLMSPAAYEFDGVGVFGTFQPLLSAEVTQWACPGWADWALGIAYEILHTVTLTNNTRNYFGLEILSAQVAWPGTTAVVRAGKTITNWNAQDYPHFYPETKQPIFQNAGFYFGHVGSDPLPGHFVFTITNTTPLIIASVGDPGFEIAGYAKLAIVNGYTNKFAYLGQYFDKAYKANPDGTRSTNETGFLSPYGEFLATEPGKTFLTTKPDGVSTNVGECVVNVIKLQLDVNHDGTMETAWNSPDNTTQNNPFMFWVNNNYDRLTIDKDDNTYYDDDVFHRRTNPQRAPTPAWPNRIMSIETPAATG